MIPLRSANLDQFGSLRSPDAQETRNTYMPATPYVPLYAVGRGKIVESVHNGAIAIVDVTGKLVAWMGDPYAVTFLRSSAKPFQALPFLEQGGQAAFGLTPREIALACASHSGTDEHVAVVCSMQMKAGVSEADLLCGVHHPYDEATADALRERKETPTPNRNNCSGKHTAMLAFTHLNQPGSSDSIDVLAYIDPNHPIQQKILHTFAAMCDVPPEKVELGIDGCSAPNFAIPLYNAALAYARLCDPQAGHVAGQERVDACHTITSAMMFNPDMVGGPGRFDTRLMEVSPGRLLVKGGAEGFQALGIMPGGLYPNSPALGVALKISDGDQKSRARPAVALEILRQLGALSQNELDMLAEFGPVSPVENLRRLVVGECRPVFQLRQAQ
jgi:L-asparaginase II